MVQSVTQACQAYLKQAIYFYTFCLNNSCTFSCVLTLKLKFSLIFSWSNASDNQSLIKMSLNIQNTLHLLNNFPITIITSCQLFKHLSASFVCQCGLFSTFCLYSNFVLYFPYWFSHVSSLKASIVGIPKLRTRSTFSFRISTASSFDAILFS